MFKYYLGIGVAAFLVVLVLIIYFFSNSSPLRLASLKSDAQKIDTLDELVYLIEDYYYEFEKLPTKLSELNSLGVSRVGIALDSSEYTYKPLDSKNYQLCANFSNEDRTSLDYSHGKGNQCFKHSVANVQTIPDDYDYDLEEDEEFISSEANYSTTARTFPLYYFLSYQTYQNPKQELSKVAQVFTPKSDLVVDKITVKMKGIKGEGVKLTIREATDAANLSNGPQMHTQIYKVPLNLNFSEREIVLSKSVALKSGKKYALVFEPVDIDSSSQITIFTSNIDPDGEVYFYNSGIYGQKIQSNYFWYTSANRDLFYKLE